MLNNTSIEDLGRFIALVFSSVLFLVITSCSTNESTVEDSASSKPNSSVDASVKTDGRIFVIDNQVSFVLPDGFKSLKIGDIKENPIQDDSPLRVFGNESKSSLIKIYYAEFELAPEELTLLKNRVERMHIELKWITSEIAEINGRRWFHFEWEQPVVDTTLIAPPTENSTDMANDRKPMHYQEYTTSFKEKNLHFVFESHVKDYPKIKNVLMKSIETIQIED